MIGMDTRCKTLYKYAEMEQEDSKEKKEKKKKAMLAQETREESYLSGI